MENLSKLEIKTPADIFFDEKLDKSHLRLYGKIVMLSWNQYGYCWATNDFLGDQLGVQARSIQRTLTVLKERGYVRAEYVRRGKKTHRKLFPRGILVNTDYQPEEIPENPIQENADLNHDCGVTPDVTPCNYGVTDTVTPEPFGVTPDVTQILITNDSTDELIRTTTCARARENLVIESQEENEPPDPIFVTEYMQIWKDAFPTLSFRATRTINKEWIEIDTCTKQEILVHLQEYVKSADYRFLKSPVAYLQKEEWGNPVIARFDDKDQAIVEKKAGEREFARSYYEAFMGET